MLKKKILLLGKKEFFGQQNHYLANSNKIGSR